MKYSPVANALKLIGGKWKIMILDSLLSKHMRFGELKRSLNGITSQMLSKQLKDMERDKLLIKKISKIETLNTEYSLTEFGKRSQFLWEIEATYIIFCLTPVWLNGRYCLSSYLSAA